MLSLSLLLIIIIMSCPHGHAPRPEEAYGSGECYTCLEKDVEICGRDYCIRYAQCTLEGDESLEHLPPWYLKHINSRFGKVTKENYRDVVFLLSRFCDCEHPGDAAHDEQECVGVECGACGVVKCPKNEPLHFHHDGCPACSTATEELESSSSLLPDLPTLTDLGWESLPSAAEGVNADEDLPPLTEVDLELLTGADGHSQ